MSVTVKCAWCGKEIVTYPSVVARHKKRNSKFYCSKECKSNYWSTYRTGCNNPKTKSRALISCFYCGDLFEIEQWRLKKANYHFCSNNCKHLWMSESFSGEKHHQYKKDSHIKTVCAQCSKEFIVRKTQFERYKLHFCSKECANNYKKGKTINRDVPKVKCICPVCGNEFEQSRNVKRKKKTCSIECAHKLKGLTRNRHITLQCHFCGKEYSVPKCEEGRSKYCSRSCLALDKIASPLHNSTLPERIIKEQLNNLGIGYIHQFTIDKMTVDFYVPALNLVLEVNGDYWHGNPNIYSKNDLDTIQKSNIFRDKRRNAVLTKMGYRVKYLWESDIKNNAIEILKNALIMNP